MLFSSLFLETRFRLRTISAQEIAADSLMRLTDPARGLRITSLHGASKGARASWIESEWQPLVASARPSCATGYCAPSRIATRASVAKLSEAETSCLQLSGSANKSTEARRSMFEAEAIVST